jgi:predicted Zn-dependent protease
MKKPYRSGRVFFILTFCKMKKKYSSLVRLLIFSIVLFFFSGQCDAIDIPKGVAVRDAEIEKYLKEYIDPIFTVAGLNPKDAKIILVNENTVNAAALPNSTMVLYAGFIRATKSVEQVIGVIAHEVGHIAGRHHVRGYAAMEKAQKTGMMVGLLGLTLGILSGRPDVGMATAVGSMSQSIHSFLSYHRGEESAADMAALKFLEKLNWTSKGLMEFLETLQGQELLNSSQQDPYLRTHPLTRDRIESIRVKINPSMNVLPKEFYETYRLIHMKIDAFLFPVEKVEKKYNGQSDLDKYAQAILAYRGAYYDKAISIVNCLIEKNPGNPFYHEFKGQILFESGKVNTSIPSYEKAVELMPSSALLRIGLSQSLLRQDKKDYTEKAIKHLRYALRQEKDNITAWHLLAIALGKQGNMADMALALAEEASYKGDWSTALEQAKRALWHLKKDGKASIRANDIKLHAEANLRN